MRSLALVGRAFARLIELRIALFAAEFQLERMRLIRCLVLSILGATLLGTSFLTATALIVFSVAEENRLTVLGIATVLLFGSAALCIGFSLHYVFGGRSPFKASTDALKEDGACLLSHLK
jgi:uncharacterized membrane protein YqjE